MQGALSGHGFWQAFAEHVSGNVVEALVTSFAFSAVSVAASNITKCFQCFKEGTPVSTADGLKAIEEIREGDLVLAYDEETGGTAYKRVTHLFRNETTEWYKIRVNGEAITCTAGHPFYLPAIDKFIPAEQLEIGENLLLSNGEYGIIESIEVESLDCPEPTYNLEVEDYHTYYVGNNEVLVHNKCGGLGKKSNVDNVIDETVNGQGNMTSQFTLSPEEALEAGEKFLGSNYSEIGKAGSGVFRSGNKIFRIDNSSLKGLHAPYKSHFHLEILRENGARIVNNHIIIR